MQLLRSGAALLLATASPPRGGVATANLLDFFMGKKTFDPPVVMGDEVHRSQPDQSCLRALLCAGTRQASVGPPW